MKWVTVALLALFTTACAATGSTREPVGELVVINQNWYAKTVRLYCGGALQVTIRGLVTGQTYEKPLMVPCDREAHLSVEYEGGLRWVSPPFSWEPGQPITLQIGPSPSHNSYWLRLA